MKPTIKTLWIIGIVLVSLLILGVVLDGLRIWRLVHMTPPPITVSATPAKIVTWQSQLSAVGTLTAINGVDINSQAAGQVSEIHFNSGQFVHAGDLLLLLDAKIEAAQLKNHQAQLKLAQLSYNRDAILLKRNAASPAAVDADLAQLQEAEADVESATASIAQKTIRAPFNGYLGIRLVNLGQYIQPGTAIVTLQALDPLYVQFNVPEQELPNLYMGQRVSLSFNLPDISDVNGTITAINSRVDQTTHNIMLQANIANSGLKLRPGMFALVTVWLRAQQHVVIVPETSIDYTLHGDAVFVIENDKEKKEANGSPWQIAVRRYVTVGERRGDHVAILTGVKPNDLVITSGQLKLQNNAHVAIGSDSDD